MTDLNTLLTQGREELARRRKEEAAAREAKEASARAWWQECLAAAAEAVGPDVASHFKTDLPVGFAGLNGSDGATTEEHVRLRIEGMAPVRIPMRATADGTGQSLIWLTPSYLIVEVPARRPEPYPIADLHVALARAAEIGDQEIPF